MLRTCVSPDGHFVYGLHQPSYSVINMRCNDQYAELGSTSEDLAIDNQKNFPSSDITVEQADFIYEVPNPFPFRGTTYIGKKWADSKATQPTSICLPQPQKTSFRQTFEQWQPTVNFTLNTALESLPEPLLLALATCSTDSQDLTILAQMSCKIECDSSGKPTGLIYTENQPGKFKPVYKNEALFEALVNNPHLPNEYKEAMVLRPGVQGGSEIVGEWEDNKTGSHIFEYLRSNSYIPWGHYAANMANDSIRYAIANLTENEMVGLRHLYYQRVYSTIAEQLSITLPRARSQLSADEIEDLRKEITTSEKREELKKIPFNSTLWGWNYGFDYSPSHYRLHASHQQIHQQFALLSRSVQSSIDDNNMTSYACGDLIADFIKQYGRETGQSFFDSYIKAIKQNVRMDGQQDKPASLIVYEDENVILFVPKAQTSQWELQLMTVKPVGNILEADTSVRRSLDKGMHIAMRVLTGLGAKMITTIEFSKRFDGQSDMRLLYSFLPKLPQSMGAFSEAQLRWINGHYPEDFAIACRTQYNKMK